MLADCWTPTSWRDRYNSTAVRQVSVFSVMNNGASSVIFTFAHRNLSIFQRWLQIFQLCDKIRLIFGPAYDGYCWKRIRLRSQCGRSHQSLILPETGSIYQVNCNWQSPTMPQLNSPPEDLRLCYSSFSGEYARSQKCWIIMNWALSKSHGDNVSHFWSGVAFPFYGVSLSL